VSRSIRLLREKMLSTRKPEEPNFNFNHVRGSQEAFGEPPWTGPGPWARGPGPSGPNTATKSESPAPRLRPTRFPEEPKKEAPTSLPTGRGHRSLEHWRHLGRTPSPSTRPIIIHSRRPTSTWPSIGRSARTTSRSSARPRGRPFRTLRRRTAGGRTRWRRAIPLIRQHPVPCFATGRLRPGPKHGSCSPSGIRGHDCS